jgi:hypothetical protein
MYMSGLYERSIAFRPDPKARLAGKRAAYCEMLLSGVTTVADLSSNDEGRLDLAAQSGLRVFIAPGFASGRWHMDNGWQLKYRWDEAAGRRGLDVLFGAGWLAAKAQIRPEVVRFVWGESCIEVRHVMLPPQSSYGGGQSARSTGIDQLK